MCKKTDKLLGIVGQLGSVGLVLRFMVRIRV